ncbi:polysaccharide lyase family 1 protein, partial [Cadophora sp. DSE1049]
YNNIGHAFEIGASTYVIAEDNIFQNIAIIAQSLIESEVFTALSTSTNAACSVYLKHICQLNGFGNSGTFSENDTSFFSDFLRKNITNTTTYTIIVSSI